MKMKKEAMAKMKEEEGMKMKKESMAKMKEAMKMKKESMAKQAKPDFPDIDGDGNTTESMKKAAADKKGSPAPQTARQAKKATKKARKFVRKANRITDRANKYIKRKGKDAGMVVDETGEKVERYELTPKQAKKFEKKKARAAKAFSKAKGVEAEFMSKYKSPASQKKESQALKDHSKRVAEIMGSYHGKGVDTTGYAKTGRRYKYFDTKESKKAVKDIKKQVKNSEKQAIKEGKAEGFNITFNKK